MSKYDLTRTDLDYTMARPLGSSGEFERIIDSDYPMNLDGTPAGPDDVFKLEYSGWNSWVEFAPKQK